MYKYKSMPKKSKKPTQNNQTYEDYFNPDLFTVSNYLAPQNSYLDTIDIPVNFFEGQGGIVKKGRPKKKKKKKKIVLKVGDKIKSDKFKYTTQEYVIENEYEGAIMSNPYDYQGGIYEIIDILPDIIDDIIDTGDNNLTDLVQITIQSIDDEEFFESDWETIGSIGDTLPDTLEDTGNWYNKTVDTKTKSYIYTSKAVNMTITIVENPYDGSGCLKVQSKKDFKAKKSVK